MDALWWLLGIHDITPTQGPWFHDLLIQLVTFLNHIHCKCNSLPPFDGCTPERVFFSFLKQFLSMKVK